MNKPREAENNERLFAAATVYGVGTRSYNRSAEKRELDRQRAEATARYERGEMKLGDCVVGPICNCRSFNLPHDINRHRELRSDMDWRTEAERGNVELEGYW